MKKLINRRVQVLWTYEGLVLLQYRVKSLFFGIYVWKTVAVIVVDDLMNFDEQLELLQLQRGIKQQHRRFRIEKEIKNLLNLENEKANQFGSPQDANWGCNQTKCN